MSHEKRMHMIDEKGAGGFALEEGHKLDSSAVEKIQETVDVSEIVAKYDKESVYRSFKGWLDIFIKILCIAFSAFHLYTAATTPFAPQIQRAVHLGFVLTLIYLLYPARATGNMNKLAWYDAILAIAGAVVCGYIVWQYDIIVLDAGPATELDFIMGCASILLVLEATRRIVGIPITLVAVVFLLYAKFGNLIPGMLGHPGFSVQRIVSHMYLTTEGLFGMPLGVSASFVFLFILFGAFLHSTGLGKFFIDLALAAAGRYVGGPAKVAVLASGFFGTISGSSVANTVSAKATKAALFFKARQELLLAFFRFLLRLCRSFLLVRRRIELVGDHDDAIMFYAVFVGPLFGFEVALHGQQNALGYLGERIGAGVVAPGFHVDESGNTLCFLSILLLTAYCQ